MHVLTVLDHPDINSFSHATARHFMEGVKAAGHTTELADLHAEGFDPRWSIPDLAQNEGKPMPPDVLAEQTRIDRCDAICLIFPLFWFGMPAMMKGWLDRVWSWGWAYDQLDDYNKSLQKSRTGVMLVPSGAASFEADGLELDKAMTAIWRDGTMGFFGMSNTRIHFLNGSTGSYNRRIGLLKKARKIGSQLDENSNNDGQ
ncbi:MAG: NAD(P)H-dependent oxidoreductase [Rhizobiaceae bacterium]